jgi:para-aminobenzoate synthetase component 1
MEEPLELYRRLRAASPASYGAFLGAADYAVASISPEMFLRLDGRSVETRPIKGTRPRAADPATDVALHDELVGSSKDRAENLMIVDLLRNDLGRVCEVGTIRVPTLFGIESHATVHHMVSVVRGELRSSLGPLDLLRACSPGGSVTGCPKIRAMQIIDELEPTSRSVYCGAIGFVGMDGGMEMSIAIRTATWSPDRVYYQVGGAIVADSDPEAEYQETIVKARPFLKALNASLPAVGPEGDQ